MHRSLAAEVFSVPLYIILGVIVLGLASLIIPALSMGHMGDWQAIVFNMAVIFLPATLATLPAYGVSVALRRKGMSFAVGCGLFFMLALLGIVFYFAIVSRANKDIVMGAVVVSAILAVVFAGLERNRPQQARG